MNAYRLLVDNFIALCECVYNIKLTRSPIVISVDKKRHSSKKYSVEKYNTEQHDEEKCEYVIEEYYEIDISEYPITGSYRCVKKTSIPIQIMHRRGAIDIRKVPFYNYN